MQEQSMDCVAVSVCITYTLRRWVRGKGRADGVLKRRHGVMMTVTSFWLCLSRNEEMGSLLWRASSGGCRLPRRKMERSSVHRRQVQQMFTGKRGCCTADGVGETGAQERRGGGEAGMCGGRRQLQDDGMGSVGGRAWSRQPLMSRKNQAGLRINL